MAHCNSYFNKYIHNQFKHYSTKHNTSHWLITQTQTRALSTPRMNSLTNSHLTFYQIYNNNKQDKRMRQDSVTIQPTTIQYTSVLHTERTDFGFMALGIIIYQWYTNKLVSIIKLSGGILRNQVTIISQLLRQTERWLY